MYKFDILLAWTKYKCLKVLHILGIMVRKVLDPMKLKIFSQISVLDSLENFPSFHIFICKNSPLKYAFIYIIK